jgi:hypothetical protein
MLTAISEDRKKYSVYSQWFRIMIVGPHSVHLISSQNPLTLHDALLEYLGRSEGPLGRNKNRGTDNLTDNHCNCPQLSKVTPM